MSERKPHPASQFPQFDASLGQYGTEIDRYGNLGASTYYKTDLSLPEQFDYPTHAGPSIRSASDQSDDDIEDDLSVGSGDGVDEAEQDWIEEDPTASASQALASQSRRARRFRLTHEQTRFLTGEFSRQQHPDSAQRERLANAIPGLTPRQVQVWFQNRRAKVKRINSEEQQRMERLEALSPGVASLYSRYKSPPYNNSLPSLISSPPSHYDRTTLIGNLSRGESRRESRNTAYNQSIAGASTAGNPYSGSTHSLQSLTGQPSLSYSPTSASHYGVSWQTPYTSTAETQSSLGAFQPLSSTDMAATTTPASYSSSALLSEFDSPLTSHGGYGGGSSFPTTLPTSGLSYQSTTSYPTDSLHSTSLYDMPSQGLRSGDLSLDTMTSSGRHHYVDESSQLSSSGYSDFPTNFSSSHSPHYHSYH